MLYCSHHLIFHTCSFLCIMKPILHNHQFYYEESREITALNEVELSFFLLRQPIHKQNFSHILYFKTQ